MSLYLTPENALRLLTDSSAASGYRRFIKTTIQEALRNLNNSLPPEEVRTFIETVREELGIVLKEAEVQTLLSLNPLGKGAILANGMVDTESREEALNSVCLYLVGCKMPSPADLEGTGFTRNQFIAAVQTQAQSFGFTLQTSNR